MVTRVVFSRYEKDGDRNHESFISVTYRHNQMWRAVMKKEKKKKKKHDHLALVLANRGRSIAGTFRKRGKRGTDVFFRSARNVGHPLIRRTSGLVRDFRLSARKKLS